MKPTMREILASSEKLAEFLKVTHDPGCTGWIPFDERGGRIACATCNSDLKKEDKPKPMKVNKMGVVIREWKVTVQLMNPKYGDYTEISTTIYHTNEAMAKVAGVKKLEDRLDITIEEEDWGYTTTAEEVK